MKTLPLRQLLRHPATVRKLTNAGQAVQITDHGEPLWVLRPAGQNKNDDAERRRLMDGELDALLKERRSKISGAKLVLDSRGP